jgi:superfamily II DNA or RNA helicase
MTIWKLRDHQRPAFDTANGRSRVIVNMPTGWGKSFLLCALAASDLQETSRKVVLCVPQRIIAKGFVQEKIIELPDGTIVPWSVPRNLCGASTAKADALTDFLQSPAGNTVASRVVLTTHMTLSNALKRLSDDELADAAEGLTGVIDESHHILAAEQERNVLGQQVSRLLDLNLSGFKLWLATAYFFRGDHLPIISETHLAEFSRVHVPFDVYWKALKYIQSYSYDFVAFKGTVFEELKHVLRNDPASPTIVYCPPEGHRMLLGNGKATFVERLKRIACRSLNAQPWTSFAEAVNQQSVVIDLVETEGRTEKIQFIAEHGDQVAAILTVGMFREGADWVEAGRIIDLVPTNSDQDRLQRFGRLVRDCPDKNHISYLSFFPFVVEQNEEERRRQLTKLYAHFHASLVLENAIDPIKISLRPRPKHQKPSDKDTGTTRFNPLGEFSESQQETIIRASYESLIRLHTQAEASGHTANPEQVRQTLVSTLKANGVTKDHVQIAKQVLLLMRRKANVSLKTDDLVDAGFDKVWSSDIFNPIIAYSGEIGGPKTLAEIRDVVEGVFVRQWHENYEQVRGLPGVPDTQSSAYWWCTHNRTLKASGNLSDEQAKLLEEIPWWKWTISIADRWDANFELIKDMESCPKSGTQEYTWVRQQRRFHQDGKLEIEKVRLLDSIFWWEWSSLSGNWESKFVELSALPTRPERGSKLYEWLRTQRKAFKAGRLSMERTKKLESISWWEWQERRSSRADGVENLRVCIREGIELGHTKSQVAEKWAEVTGVGTDQVHKYLRNTTPALRKQWDCLVDERGKKKSGSHSAESS